MFNTAVTNAYSYTSALASNRLAPVHFGSVPNQGKCAEAAGGILAGYFNGISPDQFKNGVNTYLNTHDSALLSPGSAALEKTLQTIKKTGAKPKMGKEQG